MARSLDHKCKQCRREGEKLFLKGERCFTAKCPIVKRNYPPGQHGPKRQMKMSQYGLQLREKQRVKRSYRMLEKQFRRTFDLARGQEGNTGENMLRLLEMRLDNVVYRAGLSESRDQARQLVNHSHFLVNGKTMDIPSYHLRVNDVVTLKPGRLEMKYFQEALKTLAKHQNPSWLKLDPTTLTMTVVSTPTTEELKQGHDMQLIVEYYSR